MNALCRHCFTLFDFRRVGVLCLSEPCSHVLDTAGRRKPRFMLPDADRLWKRRGKELALDAACPYCGQRERLVPACPRCRHALDPTVGKVEDRMIGVLGARDSGKSHYLSALLHLLLRGNIGGDVWEVTMDARSRQAAERELLRPLFEELRELTPTARGAGIELRPVLRNRLDGRQVLLVFRDLAGEVMANPRLLAEARFLLYAEGLVVLADPQAMAGRRRTKAAADAVSWVKILENYRQVLEAHPRTPQEDEELALRPARKLLAVAVTKADLVLPTEHPFWNEGSQAHLGSGYWQGRAAESATARQWLEEKLGGERTFAQAVEGFGDVSCFFVSSYGYRYRPHSRRKLPEAPRPQRVHEPIFALLDRFAMEPEAGGVAKRRASQRTARDGRRDDDVL